MRDGLDPRDLAEKRSAPRALDAIEYALYGAPIEGSQRAWLARLVVPIDARRRGLGRATLDAVVARALADGATSLTAGGPPGNYLSSGVDASDLDALSWLSRRGFTERGRHADLVVSTSVASPYEPCERCPDALATFAIDWISRHFARSWALEAERAHAHRGLFIARFEDQLSGFAAHSGNLCHRGTFGPIGVLPAARTSGAGTRLAKTVLHDLAERGFASATVPWVDLATVPFYERFCVVASRSERVTMTLDLARR